HYGQSIVPADLAGVSEIAAGGYHSVALLTNGTVRCWGRNNSGQCSVPAGLSGVVAIAAGGNTDVAHTVALLSNGTVRAWGNDDFGQVTAPAGLTNVTSIGAGGYFTLGVLSPSASSCADAGGSGTAILAVNGGSWSDVIVWDWVSGSGPRVPGALTNVDLGAYGSVGSTCDAQAGSLVSRSGSTLLVPVDLSVPASGQPDHSIDVSGTSTLAGRIWLLGSGASVLPADLNIPVLRSGNPVGSFDIIQTTVPAPAGKFLALVPSAGVLGQTLYSLRLLDLTGNASLTGASTGGFSGSAVAAEAMDWNGDGFDDLALAIDFGPGQPGTLQVLLNDGQGNLGTTSVQVSTASSPSCLAVGDVNGDGKIDAVVGTTSNNRAQVYLNNAPSQTPPFTSGFSLNPSGIPRSVCVVPPASSLLGLSGGGVGVGTGGSGDASGNKLTFFTLSTGGVEQVVSLPSTPTTTTTRGRRLATGGASSTTVGGGSEPGRVVVLDPGSTGSYGITQVMNVPGEPVGLDFVDMDGDGKDEVVSANANPVLQGSGSAYPVLTLFRGQTGGGFGGAVPIAPLGASRGLDVSLIDADGDGDRDIVSVQRTVGTQSAAVLIRIDTTGAGGPLTIGEETDLGATAPILSTRGDLDGVGGEDLFLVDQASSFMGGGSAPVAKPYLGAPGNACPADIDGDGQVGGADLGALLSSWGSSGAADVNGDGVVDGADLGTLLSSWGSCAP
ncbi:MAG: FG-GAP-like repeat-containing protein, partial [Planctomycetota bacterium]